MLLKEVVREEHARSTPVLTKVILRGDDRDLPGVPVVKTSPSSAGGVGSILGGGAKIPHVLGPKHKTEATL